MPNCALRTKCRACALHSHTGAFQYIEKGHFLMINAVIDVLMTILQCKSLFFFLGKLLMGLTLATLTVFRTIFLELFWTNRHISL